MINTHVVKIVNKLKIRQFRLRKRGCLSFHAFSHARFTLMQGKLVLQTENIAEIKSRVTIQYQVVCSPPVSYNSVPCRLNTPSEPVPERTQRI